MKVHYFILALIIIMIAAYLIDRLARKGVSIAIRTPLGSLEFNPSGKLLNS